jgi:hypothetical protein
MEKNSDNLPAIAPLELAYGDITLTCPIENGHRMVPVRTVCDIIDVDFKNQDSWLKKHPIYAQLYIPSTTVALDNKERTMNCLSFFDLFGWLNSIGEKDRKPGSFDKQMTFMAWLRERHMEIYKAVDVWRQENKYELQLLEDKEAALQELETANDTVKEVKKRLALLNTTIEDIRAKRYTGQTALPFPS